MKNRWFRVVADHFDWRPTRGFMKAYRRGQIGFGTRACVEAGLASGAIELIERPEGAKVGKDGRVIFGS